MRRSVVLRIVTVAVGVVALLGASAGPASAHTIGGPRPTNYRSRIVAFEPPVPGISARIVDLGNQFEVTNRTPVEITVLGYEGEDYLRIGPDGVFENLHSQATYINVSRLGGTVPVGIDTAPSATPQWKKISSGHSARWHDHRIHWMSPQAPPPVAQSPGSFYHLSQQNIVFLRGPDRARVAIAVALDWVPGPSGVPWIPVIIVLFALGAVAAFLPRWRRALAVLVGVVVVSDIAHAIGFELPRPGGNPAKVLQFLGGSFVSIAVWIAAVPTILMVLRRRAEALYGVVFVGLLIALIGGATDLSALWKSQIPDAGPALLTRIEVVVALGIGGGIVVGAVARMLRTRAPGDAAGDGRWLSSLVVGLSDAELARIVPELDADEVLGVALAELATRAEPIAGAFTAGSVVFVATDPSDPDAAVSVWSVARSVPANRPTHRAGGATAGGPAVPPARQLAATRGVTEPEAARLRAPFDAWLRLLAGTVGLDAAAARGTVAITGDARMVDRLSPFLAESPAVSPAVEDPTSAP